MVIKSMVIPLPPNILVKPACRKKDGLELPDDMKEEHGEGEILEVYEGCEKLRPGDMVIFNKYHPTQIKHNGEILYLADIKDILALIKIK